MRVLLVCIALALASCAVDSRREAALKVVDECEASGGCTVVPDKILEQLLKYIEQLEDAVGKTGV